MKNQKNAIIIGIVALAVLAVALVFSLRRTAQTKTEMAEMVEMMNFEKEQLEDEYEELAVQFDGYQLNVGNDSLVQLLAQEKERVNQLLEELRTTKATNARRIAERINAVLVTENREVKQRYQEVSRQAEQLEQEKQELSQVVTRAAMMEVTNCTITLLNSRDRKTTRYNQIAKMQFDFTILKNITTDPGNKTVYLRIIRPDGEVMVKSDRNMFTYENRQIPYSLSKNFEYAGETLTETLYWPVEEILQIGTYAAEYFIDGNLVGQFAFKIEK